MITIDKLRDALRQPQPWTAMDELVRAEQAEGRKVQEIYDELRALVEPVRALDNPPEDADDAMMDTLDALVGNCRSDSTYYDPPNTSLPTQEEIAKLPRWARVAFAARCARRVMPLFMHFWPNAPEEHIKEVADDVEAAEQYARKAAPAIDFNDAVVAALAARMTKFPLAAVVARAAARAIQSAKDGHVDDNAREAAEAADAAAEAADAAAEAADAARILGGIRPIIRRDFDHLARLAQWQHWTDDTPVPPEVFGPLWPEGPPAGWPADPDAPQPAHQQVTV
ncbi:MAG TPA: hypothetical protein VM533_11280 [Fimbriiglobus sp.]|jgi:hypothetical protein|nr:hypothetical protein [Fimbriiglobus sp.]